MQILTPSDAATIATIERLRAATRRSTYDFAVEVCSHGMQPGYTNNLTKHNPCITLEQKIVCDFVDAPVVRTPYRMIMASRKSMKTTIAQMLIMRTLLNDRNFSIAYAGAKKPMVADRMDFIAKMFAGEDERSLIPFAFGDNRSVLDSFLKTDLKLHVTGRTRHTGYASITGYSNDSKITGWHGYMQVIDDLQDEDGAESEKSRQAAIASFLQGKALLMPGGQVLMLCTPYHLNDLSMQIFRGERGDWDILYLPAYNWRDEEHMEEGLDFDSPRFPWNLPEWVLEQERKGSPDIFGCQYLLDPLSKADRIFHEKFWKTWTDEELAGLSKEAHSFVLVDPGWTDHNRSDATSALWWRFDPANGCCYQVDKFQEKIHAADLPDVARRVLQKCWEQESMGRPVRTIYIENASGGGAEALKSVFEHIIGKSVGHSFITIQFVAHRRENKTVRARAIKDRYQAGLIKYAPGNESNDIRDELMSFPNTNKDGFVDCTSYLIQVLPTFDGGNYSGTVDLTQNRARLIAEQREWGPGRMPPKHLRAKPPWEMRSGVLRVIGPGDTRGGPRRVQGMVKSKSLDNAANRRQILHARRNADGKRNEGS